MIDNTAGRLDQRRFCQSQGREQIRPWRGGDIRPVRLRGGSDRERAWNSSANGSNPFQRNSRRSNQDCGAINIRNKTNHLELFVDEILGLEQ